MAIEFIQFSNATATDGAIVAADLIDFAGGATEVSVQMIKFGFGTDSVFNQVATGQGLPIATGPVYQIQQMATATSPVSVGTWTATGQLLTSPLASATQPVSVGTWTATGIVRIDTHSTATIPVSIAAAITVGDWTATQGVLTSPLASATGPVSIATWTATGTVNLATTATLAVEVTDVIPGTGASNLGKAEDAPHSSGDVGVMVLAVREDPPVLQAATGDYTPLLTGDDGSLWVHETPNEIESGNSTTTPLGISAVFTGAAVDVLEHAAITLQIWADEDSATDGMQFQFSIDGTNWDVEHLHTFTAANGGRLFTFAAHTQFFRFIYTNGTTGQGAFRVQTLLHHVSPITTIHRLVDDVSPDRSSTLHKSVIIAQAAGSGDFVPVQSTMGGNLKISLEEADTGLTGGGVEATALRVTVASDSTGVLSVDDNDSSLTVDNAGLTELAAAIDANSVLQTTNAGTATMPVTLGTNEVFVSVLATATANVAVGAWTATGEVRVIQDLDTATDHNTTNHPFGPYGDQVTAYLDITATTVATLATSPGANNFNDLVSLFVSNHATSPQSVSIRETATATLFNPMLAADGGGFIWQPTKPTRAVLSATAWTVQASAATGVKITAEFQTAT